MVQVSAPPVFPQKEARNLHCLLATSLVSLLLVLSLTSSLSPSSSSSSSPSSSSPRRPFTSSILLSSSLPLPPSIAYLLSGSSSDADRLLRLLSAVYHPNNLYLLHLDLSAPQEQRDRLALAVRRVPVFRSRCNVHVVGSAGFSNPRGSSALAATLRGAAVLLRLKNDWDWFINLEASDYPLVTQDDLLHILSFLPRDVNFIQHTSHFGLRESQRVKPIIVDPGLYLSRRTGVFYGTQKRELPDAYKLFSGSASVILSRRFIEFCILGTDNLPRSLLMYHANTPSSQTKYFHTVICNSQAFNKTIINDNLHYTIFDTSPRRVPRPLNLMDFHNITQSGAVFGSNFPPNDPVLDRIDMELLNHRPGEIVRGGWCVGSKDPCDEIGNVDVLFPGPGARRLEKLMMHLLSTQSLHTRQCIWE